MLTADNATQSRPLIVVDASAVVSLLIDPASAGAAIARRMKDSVLLAPELLPFEVANVLRRRCRAGLLSKTEAALAHDGLLELPIELWPWEVIAERAWQLGENLTSYDAAYVALAERVAATLITRDKRIAGAPDLRCDIEVY